MGFLASLAISFPYLYTAKTFECTSNDNIPRCSNTTMVTFVVFTLHIPKSRTRNHFIVIGPHLGGSFCEQKKRVHICLCHTFIQIEVH